MTDTQKWLDIIRQQGLICDAYKQKLDFATSKADIFQIICDPNGVSFFAELLKQNVPVPLDVFSKDFALFLNGNKVVHYPNGVSSKMYIGHKDTVHADTTLVALYNCECEVIIPNNKYPKILLGAQSNVSIYTPPTARLTLEVYNDSKYILSGDQTRAKIFHK